jgi:thioredoxin-related protein
MKYIIKTAILLFMLSMNFGLIAQHNQINWMSVDEVQAAMDNEPKKILMDVYTSWCGPCKMMMKNTFTDPNVIEYINKHYYAVKFNAEGEKEVTFKGNTYKNPNYDPNKANTRNGTHEFTMAVAPVNGRIAYPTIVYMDENYAILSPVQGYLKPDQIMPILSYFGDNSYKTTDWQTFSASYGQ